MAAASSNFPPKSESSTTESLVVKQEQPYEDVSSEILGSTVVIKSDPIEDSKEVKKESLEKPFDIMDEKARIEKLKKYEADYKQYLMSEYFSDKTTLGGNIYDVKSNIEGQTISASRFPPCQSFVDPASFLELIRKESSSSDETPTGSDSNEKP